MPKGSSLSSDDKEQLKGLRSVLVPPDQILSGMTLQEKATSEPLHTASGDGGEEALPQGCQEQLRMALDRKLDKELAEGPAVTHRALENSEGVAAAPQSLASGDTFSLFKRARRAAFSPESVNRRVPAATQEVGRNAVGPPKKRRRVQEHLSANQLHERARAAVVEGELIKAAARQLAASAAESIQPVRDDCSEDEYEDSEPQGTVTRVLRGLVANAILTGNMQPSQHQRWKLSSSAPGSGNAQKKIAADLKQYGGAGAEIAALSEQKPHNRAAAAPNGCPKKQQSSDSRLTRNNGLSDLGDKQPAIGCKATGSAKGLSLDCTGSAKLSEEERRARKRAKKQRQKQATSMDPVRRDQEKEKRTKRRRAKKAKVLGAATVG